MNKNKVLAAGFLLFFPGTILFGQSDVATSSQPVVLAYKKAAGKIGFNNPVSTLVRQEDGKILVGGNFSSYSGKLSGSGVARLNSDGSLDQEFANQIAGLFYHAYFPALVVQADQKIVLGGVFKREAGRQAPVYGLARLLPDGSWDNDFIPGLTSEIKGIVECMAQQSDGKILVGGSFTSLNGEPAGGLARLNPDGTFDVEFSSSLGSGVDNDGTVQDIVVRPNGKILVVGSFYKFSDHKVDGIVQLNQDGSVDTKAMAHSTRRFFYGFSVLSPEEKEDDLGPHIPDVELELDGSILLAGEFVAYDEKDNVFATHLLRVKPDGAVDFDFIKNLSRYGFHNNVESIAVQEDGRIVAGSERPFSRLNQDGTHDTVFLKSAGPAVAGIIQTLLVEPNGKIWLGGEFSGFLGVTVGNILRINANGTLDEDFLEANYR